MREARRTTGATKSYTWDGEPPTPMPLWGKDHWSTLAFVETRIVDHKGRITGEALDHMRCNPRRHRKLLGPHSVSLPPWSGKYSTVLRDGSQVMGHDDWHCVEDMVSAGLVVVWREKDRQPRKLFGGGDVTLGLTPRGLEIAAQLRTHKANGGTFAQFVPA